MQLSTLVEEQSKEHQRENEEGKSLGDGIFEQVADVWSGDWGRRQELGRGGHVVSSQFTTMYIHWGVISLSNLGSCRSLGLGVSDVSSPGSGGGEAMEMVCSQEIQDQRRRANTNRCCCGRVFGGILCEYRPYAGSACSSYEADLEHLASNTVDKGLSGE